jgi:hypothetical protein
MSQIEKWIKLLSDYGPFALLVLFVFVIELRARKALRESPAETRKPFLVVYCGVWAVIFLLVVFAGGVWIRTNVTSEYTIVGTFENFSGSEKIVSRRDGLFLCRRYLEHGRFDDAWRLITSKKLEEGPKIRFIFDRGPTKQSQENVTEHELVIRKEFYEAPLLIRYQRTKNRLILVHRGTETPIPTVDLDSAGGYSRSQGLFIGVAHAEEALDPIAFTKRLESDDPIIRRDARLALAKMGDTALPWIQKVLEDPKSSYRLQVGVITALGNMKQLKVEKLSKTTVNVIIEASVAKDEALRDSALRFLRHNSSDALDQEVERALNKAKNEGANPVKISRLARAKFEILYNLGVQEKDDYGHKLHDGKDHFQAAVKYFQGAWGLNTLAVPNDQVYFPKALYGWGHALHDRSMVETSGEQRQSELIKAAQDKFQEFLQAFEQAPNQDQYPYPEHICRAKAYKEKPEPESLRKECGDNM